MKVLVVVDMQNDFIDGALGTKEAQAIVPNVVEKIKNFVGRILVTFDTHANDYLNSLEGKNLPVKHCIEYTKGWQLREEVKEILNQKNYVSSFTKPSFGSIVLGQYLKDLAEIEPIDSIEIIGLCTDICVISNALILKAFLPEIPITVDASCCAGVTPESHKNALEAMKMCQINVTYEGV